ncbi:MAG: HEAT repeat domain-containing protein [Candidatus Rokubacteria bacterium]|nr:HEAT repeat domain-containing protein [Candidatus Rokubacteria bacterium]
MKARIPLLVGLVLLGPLGPAGAQPLPKLPLLNACAGDRSDVPYWTRALKAPDPQLRLRATQNLGESRSEAATPALTDALKDPDPAVRAEAARALQRIRRAGSSFSQ